MNIKNNINFRRFIPQDLPTVMNWYNWNEFYYYTIYPEFEPGDEIENFIRQRENTLMIEKNLKAIGICDYTLLSPKSRGCSIEITFASEEYYNTVGVQTLRSFINLLFENLDIIKISKLINEFDTKTLELCQKAGLVIEGRKKEYIFKDCKYWDLVYAATFKND